MTRTRRMLVGLVAVLSLVGTGGAIATASADTGSTSSTRWCCL